MKIKFVGTLLFASLAIIAAGEQPYSSDLQNLATEGDASAQYDLGICYANGTGLPQDNTTAAVWYTKAAEQGHPEAQYHLARCYDAGEGVLQDDEQAQKWDTLAAEQGHALAQYHLARSYVECHYYDQSYKKAAKWYTQAAMQNLGAAQYNLALAYDMGAGVPQDYALAYAWGRLASQNGNPGVIETISPRLTPSVRAQGEAQAKLLAEAIEKQLHAASEK